MKKSYPVIGFLVLFGLVFTSGCNNVRNEDKGAVAGGLLGAAIGSRFGKGRGRTAGIIVGAIAGSMVGRKIGRQFDRRDREHAARIFENNRVGHTGSWHNPDTGYHYRTTPTRTYETRRGPCREFRMQAEIRGRTEDMYGTACRTADGSWEIVK